MSTNTQNHIYFTAISRIINEFGIKDNKAKAALVSGYTSFKTKCTDAELWDFLSLFGNDVIKKMSQRDKNKKYTEHEIKHYYKSAFESFTKINTNSTPNNTSKYIN